MPLFERAMAHRHLTPYLARCYAGCAWEVTRDKNVVLAFLKKAGPVFGSNRNWWRSVPELVDVVETLAEEMKEQEPQPTNRT